MHGILILLIWGLGTSGWSAVTTKTHVVKKGDNLYQLAKEYHVTVDELKKANKLSSINLSIGQQLKIPGQPEAEPTRKKGKEAKEKETVSKPVAPKPVPLTQEPVPTPPVTKGKTKPGKTPASETTPLHPVENPPTQTVSTPETQNAAPVSVIEVQPLPKDGYHIVKPKENLFRITKMYGLDIKEVMALNNMENYNIKVGQRIKLTAEATAPSTPTLLEKVKELEVAREEKPEEKEDPLPQKIKVQEDSLELVEAYHIVQRHETLFSIAKKYNIDVEELKRINNLSTNKIFVEQKIYLKVQTASKTTTELIRTPEPELKDPSHLRGDLARPTVGKVISEFGLRHGRPHKGIDIGAPTGTPIYAALSGKVVFSGMQSGYGNVIVLEHPDFVMTVYAHNERNLVSVGDMVNRGEQIATVGATGNATASHLHFEYRIKLKAINPRKVLPDY